MVSRLLTLAAAQRLWNISLYLKNFPNSKIYQLGVWSLESNFVCLWWASYDLNYMGLEDLGRTSWWTTAFSFHIFGSNLTRLKDEFLLSCCRMSAAHLSLGWRTTFPLDGGQIFPLDRTTHVVAAWCVLSLWSLQWQMMFHKSCLHLNDISRVCPWLVLPRVRGLKPSPVSGLPNYLCLRTCCFPPSSISQCFLHLPLFFYFFLPACLSHAWTGRQFSSPPGHGLQHWWFEPPNYFPKRHQHLKKVFGCVTVSVSYTSWGGFQPMCPTTH